MFDSIGSIFAGLEPEEAKKRVDALTLRERDVATLLAQGLRNRAVAQQLGISPKTLDVHRGNICRKLGTTPYGIGRVWYCARFVEA